MQTTGHRGVFIACAVLSTATFAIVMAFRHRVVAAPAPALTA
jgi:hypothetical protein